MKKIISLFLFIYVSCINAQSYKDTATIRLMIDSVLSIKSNAIKERIKKENTIISNISFLKKFPDNNLLFYSYQIITDNRVRNGDNELAKLYIDTCYTIVKKLKSKLYYAKVKYTEGLYFKFNGKSDAAMQNWFEASEIYKTHKDESNLVGTLAAIAREYLDLKQYDKAEKYLIDIINRKLKLGDEISLSNSYNTLANVYTGTKRLDEAITYFNKAIYLSSKHADTVSLAYTYNNLARVYNKQEKIKEAKKYWEKSYDLFMKANDAFGTAMIINNMAYIQIKLKNYNEGIKYAKQAVSFSEEHDIQLELERAHSNLLDAYYGLNDFKNGFKEYEIIIDMKDARFNEDVANAVADAEQKYRNKIQQDSITILNSDKRVTTLLFEEEKNKSFNYKIILITILLFILIISIITYLWYKNKQEKTKFMQQNLLNQTVLETEQIERERIARDLHDSVGQKLSVVKMQLSMKNADTQSASNLLDEAIQDVRNVSHNLMPADLSKGLITALENLSEQVNLSSNTLQVHLHITDNARLLVINKQQSMLIYRMIQELLNNAIKYAQAKNIHINMDCNKNQLNLNLTDDGVGFDVNSIENKDGLGIKNIKERVQQMIGNVQLISKDGKGTQYQISIPV